MNGLQLGFHLPGTLGLGEFVVATLELRNVGNEPLHVAGHHCPDGGELWVKLDPPADTDTRILGQFAFHGATRKAVLEPGQCLRFGAPLSSPEADDAFRQPGRYRLRAIFDSRLGPVESPERTLQVIPSWLGVLAGADAAPPASTTLAPAPARAGPQGPRMDDFRECIATRTLLNHLTVLAVLLRPGPTPGGAGERPRALLERTLRRFGPVRVAILSTALFPAQGGSRSALCRLFESCLEDGAQAHEARAIIRGEPF